MPPRSKTRSTRSSAPSPPPPSPPSPTKAFRPLLFLPILASIAFASFNSNSSSTSSWANSPSTFAYISSLLPYSPFAVQPKVEVCPDFYEFSKQAPKSGRRSEGVLGLPSMRPEERCRTFSSPAVEDLVQDYTSRMKDSDLAMLFENALTSTLDTTIKWSDEDLTFVVTGDITAMWIRDSCNQLAIYQSLAPKDPKLATLIRGGPSSSVPWGVPLLRRFPASSNLWTRSYDQRVVSGSLASFQARQPDGFRVQVRARLDRRILEAVETVPRGYGRCVLPHAGLLLLHRHHLRANPQSNRIDSFALWSSSELLRFPSRSAEGPYPEPRTRTSREDDGTRQDLVQTFRRSRHLPLQHPRQCPPRRRTQRTRYGSRGAELETRSRQGSKRVS